MKIPIHRVALLCLALTLTTLSLYAQFSQVEGMGRLPQQINKKVPIQDLFDQTTVPSVFTIIDPEQGATIVGTEGTIVRIPPDAFVTGGAGYPVSGPVQFEMKDIARKSDILLSNVPTIADGKVLESGGVVYLNARQNGRPLKMAEDKALEVEFPQERTKAGMRGFSGRYNSNKEMNWKPMGSPLTADVNTLIFEDGEHTVQGYVSSLLKRYSACSGPSNITVIVKFNPKDGRTDMVKIVGNNRCYDIAVSKMVRTFYWEGTPEKPGEVTFTLEVNNPANNHPVATNGDIPPDETFAYYDQEYMNAIDDKRAGELANTVRVTGLGWVNWDCYPNPPKYKDFFVKVRGGKEKEFARVFIAYRDRNIVLNADQLSTGNFAFREVPVGIPAYVIGLSYMKEKPYLSVQTLEAVGKDLQVALEPTTVEALKAKVGQFLN